jgi:hypothetical protein
MTFRIRSVSSALACGCLIALGMLAALTVPARANPVLGFREPFTSTTTSWTGGTIFSNPGTGGLFGSNDGYLLLESGTPSHFGTVSFGPEYTGDWIAAGITQVRLWLDDVGAADPFEIHFAIGDGAANFWMYNVGFIPPPHAWGEFVVDLTSAANFTQIRGPGSFASALQSVDRIHIRHDQAPYLPIPNPPDPIAGDLGIDQILLTDGLVGVDPAQAPAARGTIQLAPPFPNPSRGPVTLSLRESAPGPFTFEIVDVAGRSVRRFVLPAAGGGPRTWMWDGLDDRGRRVAPGVYRARAYSEAGGTSRPLVRVN